jgi:hypothetical protein
VCTSWFVYMRLNIGSNAVNTIIPVLQERYSARMSLASHNRCSAYLEPHAGNCGDRANSAT